MAESLVQYQAKASFLVVVKSFSSCSMWTVTVSHEEMYTCEHSRHPDLNYLAKELSCSDVIALQPIQPVSLSVMVLSKPQPTGISHTPFSCPQVPCSRMIGTWKQSLLTLPSVVGKQGTVHPVCSFICNHSSWLLLNPVVRWDLTITHSMRDSGLSTELLINLR